MYPFDAVACSAQRKIPNLVVFAALAATSCGYDHGTGGATRKADPLVDNLYVIEPSAGMTADSAAGAFVRQGRCLLFKNAGIMTTPVFAIHASVGVSGAGVIIGGHLFRFGQSYSFPGLGPPARMDLGSGHCPKVASIIAGIQIQAPSVPPPPARHPPHG